jgi:hypothetical protein
VKLDVSLDALVRDEVRRAKSISLNEPGGKSVKNARLKVSASLAIDEFSGQLHAIVLSKITRTGSIPIEADIDAVTAVQTDGGPVDETVYTAHLKKAVHDAVSALDEQARLLGSGNETLVDALGSEEAAVRVAAARTLGERRAREAVEPLCDVLRRDQPQVAQAVLGSLVMIDDQRAVPCMIEWAGSDDRRLVYVMEPLASIGGTEARAFLEMIASGHDEPGIRQVAENSLRRMSPSKAATEE